MAIYAKGQYPSGWPAELRPPAQWDERYPTEGAARSAIAFTPEEHAAAQASELSHERAMLAGLLPDDARDYALLETRMTAQSSSARKPTKWTPFRGDDAQENVTQESEPVKEANKPTRWTPYAAATEEEEPWYASALTNVQRIGQGFRRTFDRAGESVRQYGSELGITDTDPNALREELRRTEQDYRSRVGDSGYAKAGEIAGALGVGIPIMAIPGGQGVGARVGLGALAGALGAQLDPTYEENFVKGKAKQAGVGALVGAAGGVAQPYIASAVTSGVGALSRGVNKLRGKPPVIDIAPDEAARLRLMEELDVPATTGEITKDPVQREAERRLAERVTEDTAPFRDYQELAKGRLAGAVQKQVEKIGPAETRYATGSAALDFLERKAEESKRIINDAYKVVRESVGDDFGMKPNNVLKLIRDEKKNAPSIGSSYQTVLNNFIQEGKNGRRLKALTVNEAESLRKEMSRRAAEETNKEGARFLRRVVEAIDEDVAAGTGSDPFKHARALAYKKLKIYENHYVDALMSGKVDPAEAADKFIVRGKIDTLKGLKTAMTQDGGNEAWDGLRASILGNALKSATVDVGERQTVNLQKLASKLREIEPEKRAILFTPDENAAIDKLAKAIEIKIPVIDQVPTGATGWEKTLRGVKYIRSNRGPNYWAIGKLLDAWTNLRESWATRRAVKQATDPVGALHKRTIERAQAGVLGKQPNVTSAPAGVLSGEEDPY